MRKCSLDCPLNGNGKCLSGNAHKKDFGNQCKERQQVINYYKEKVPTMKEGI